MKRIVRRHPDADVQLWFEDEARVGRKGRNAHVRYRKGRRLIAPTDERFKSVYVHGAVRPGTDDACGLVLPHADTATTTLVLDAFSASLAPNVHAILGMDEAGWHVTGQPKVPSNVSLPHPTPSSPESNPVERVRPHLKERNLSHRVFADVPAIVDACAKAWNDLLAENGRVAGLTTYLHLKRVETS